MPVRTHYDNLKVSRDAPSEVIRAAYKSLAQKYHPDRNPGDERAAKVMLLINEAYEVLSDPVRRKQHDLWIEAKERAARAATSPPPQPEVRPQWDPRQSPPTQPQPASQASAADAAPAPKKKSSRWSKLFWAGAVIYGLTHLFPGIKSSNTSAPPVSTSTSSNYATSAASPVNAANKPVAKPQCVAMPRSPKGRPWPDTAQTITKFRSKGHSSITLDNTGGSSNIYAKVTIAGTKTDVKDGYVPAGQSLELKDLVPGTYVVKYKNVTSGCSSISKELEINEVFTQTGVNYTHVDLTIYSVPDGNMRVNKLPDADF